ncbi:zinc-dependent peptidase [Psychroserpens ponticola]|uniref:Zinc-dependent peptidase n=1 Tax=Psychroserpens ponticola TaxID=2932268 RepID=A0ABY7RY37_9FLAO|nr:zinc-dependent peptidase [Psychroserpens ponticola]WCO01156.1 zinc-dependent peptidase [Psychroserpens ponticola]
MLNLLLLFRQPKQELSPEAELVFDALLLFIISLAVFFMLFKLFNFIEMAYIEYIKKRLFYNHLYFNKKTLSQNHKSILKQKIKFYNNLSKKHQSYFEHRVYKIINRTEFIGKELDVSDEMKLVISATLVKLTFGLRDYKIDSVERILIYPEAFYSQINKNYHKGEFNFGYRAIVLSWKDVLHGYHIDDDNLNLAVHEFIHAIHFYYMNVRKRSTSSAIFLDSFYELTQDLDKNSSLKAELVSSDYIREYAFTNQFEFLAVIIETFIETPHEFRSQFPEIYIKVKGMLNFNFSGY